ncbi:MAG: putative M18 family aminopeptidase 1 [Deltaproteobacteria bacterium ADurb.Bin510]|nr:MAG: putative M18 family aminopeptidase 1 [Deltaproteobacteria bacterium ADurb.Bin510]
MSRAKKTPQRHPAWTSLDQAAMEAHAEGYLDFLSTVKTEREAVRYFRTLAEERENVLHFVNRDKAIALCRRGRRPLSEGVRIVVAHVDAPRLDLKANPLYEEAELALFKTHYYGGIKKYQWLARPLAIHGVVVKACGAKTELVLGEKADEPCFTIEDLLPHLARKVQTEKKVTEAFVGEKLNVIVGSRPDGESGDKPIREAVLKLLHSRYGIEEEDFVSADLEVVPAGPAREVGFDRSLIGGYGQDDRLSAYAAAAALCDADEPEYTAIALLVDKEEIGSDGNTGAKSLFLEEVLWELAERFKEKIEPRRVLWRSRAISADLNAALDPDYPEVHEKANAAKLGYGVCLIKFTGSAGKVGSSEAHAEYLGWLRGVLNERGIPWQTGELGKVDEGGGGTVAKFLAEYGLDIVDVGAPALSMHSPFELASKADIYSAYLAYKAFLEVA